MSRSSVPRYDERRRLFNARRFGIAGQQREEPLAMIRVWLGVGVVVAGLGVAAWASDFITLQGTRTVYTVECHGTWQGDRCDGKLAPGDRYRYLAIKPHQQVVFWTIGTGEPVGTFDACKIRDGRNWVCRPSGDAARSVTLQMVAGEPVPGRQAATRPCHAVAKWRWILLDHGFHVDRGVRPVAPAASAA